MVELDLKQILETTDTIVQDLLATGEFDHCTFKDVLLRVDARLEFPRGTLLRCEHKRTVKERIKELLLQAEKAGDKTPSPPKKRTVGPGPKAGAKPNKRRKPDTTASDQEGSDTEPESKKAKKSRPTPKPKAKETKVDKVSKSEAKKSGTKSGNKPAISAETIDSDLDNSDPEPSTSKLPTSISPAKKKPKELAKLDNKDAGPSQVTKSQHSPQRPKAKQIPEAVGDASGNQSESELSVLLDDEPPKRRRKEKGEKSETKPKEVRKKKEKKELSKDEETIKRLKSLVVACGVRKVWSKEFKDLDSPSAQIKRLKSMLAELGMSGRMSMEQAKAIKEKREFAQELEDIQDFEKKVVGGSEGRPSRKKLGSTKGTESSDEDESDDDEDEGQPRKKRTNARNSINAFLEDQSDED